MPSLKASRQGLVRIRQSRSCKGWTIEDDRWLVAASQIINPMIDWASDRYAGNRVFAEGISRSTWKRFLNGKTSINANVFKVFCQVLELDWQTVIEAPATITLDSLHIDLGDAPDLPSFYGRIEELARLKQWILGDGNQIPHQGNREAASLCRLVAVLGMGGIGKTSLVAEMVQQIQDQFEYVIWRSLLNAPPLGEILADWIRFLSNQQEIQLSQDLDSGLARLRHYLQTHRCLLILDNVETIFAGEALTGEYRTGFEGYGQLLNQIGKVAHQSCLVITSREKPKEVARLEGQTRPVRSLSLKGLGVSEGQQISAEVADILGSNLEWQKLVEIYQGNPLGLELATKFINEFCAGSIHHFLSSGELIFDDLQELLARHFDRLAEPEKEVVYWLAINREPVSLSQISNDLLSPSYKEQVTSTLRSLQRRWMIEQSTFDSNYFTLQPVLMEYITSQIISQILQEIISGQINLLNGLALIKAQSRDYIRESQIRLILNPLITRLQQYFRTESLIRHRLDTLLQIVRDKTELRLGYAAGNLLNLYQALKLSLTAYDFSDLSIRQAYLQESVLHQVNFQNSDFIGSIFADTFGLVLSLAFSPDGQLLATGDANGEIRLWQVSNSEPMLIFKGHTDWIRSVAFSPDGQILASGSADQRIRLWSVKTGQCLKTLHAHTHWVQSIAFSRDGHLLVSGSADQTIRVWDVQTGHCLNVLVGHTHWVQFVALSPNGQLIASGSADQTVKLWDVQTGQCIRTFQGQSDWVQSVAFSPDGQFLASGNGDQTVKLWDMQTGQCLKTLQGHTLWVQLIDFSPDGQLLVSGSGDKTVRLWDIQTGQCLKTLQGHTHWVRSVTFSPDGQMLASDSDDQTVRLWDTRTGKCLKTLQGHTQWVRSIAIDPQSKVLASCSAGNIVKLWDLQTGQCFRILKGHSYWVRSACFSPDGQTLVTGSGDRTLRLWNIHTGECLRILEGHTHWVWAVAFSPDGQLLASGSEDQTIRLWDARTGECTQVLSGHQSGVRSIAFAPSGGHDALLASSSEDQTIRLWQIGSRNCLCVLQGHTSSVQSVVFSPEGQRLASASSDKTAKLWDVATGTCLQTLQAHADIVRSIAFSPNGQLIATGSADHTVRIWDCGSGRNLQILLGHQHWVWSVRFTSDGQTLISCSEDETICFWNIETGHCSTVIRDLQPYEGMNIAGVTGLTATQIATLKNLGAVEK